jgi:hypothetical protein
MKTLNLTLLTCALCALMVVSGTSASAEDFPQTTAAYKLSVTRGFNQSSVAVLNRTAAANAATVGAALTTKLCTAPCSTRSTPGDSGSLKIAGDHWSLTIVADGSSAEFQDQSVQARAHSLGKAPAQKMSAAALEQAGRDFIASRLAGVIVLGPQEELVPLLTAYRHDWDQDLHSGEMHDAIVANRVVFGRKIAGVPVVGGGSQVIVTFTNDGAVESFRYDWPKYRTASGQAVIDAGEILARVQKVISDREGGSASRLPVHVPPDGAPYPLAVTADASLHKMLCGHYDPGFAARDAKAPVQPGCIYRVVVNGSDGTVSGLAGAVPGGSRVQADGGWPESQIFHD